MKSVSRRQFIGSATAGVVGAGVARSAAGAAVSAGPAGPAVSVAGPAVAEGSPTPPLAAHGPQSLPEPVSLWDLPTPALTVDLDALEHNLAKMADHYRDLTVALRPHAKTHKCPVLAHKQVELGAIGICAAKVSEAEILVESGIDEVLITSPVVTPEKISRVVALATRSPGVGIVVDQPDNVRDFGEAATAAGVQLPVFVDLNVGTDRIGIAMGSPAVRLVEKIEGTAGLRFGGLQAYAGHVQHTVGWEYRRERSLATMERALELEATIERAGHDVPVFTGGGTGTFDIDDALEGMTDIQVGSYLFMDVNYRNVGGQGGAIFEEFRPSLLVLATAISQPAAGRITIDAGYKAFATDKEPPVPLDIDGVTYRWAGDEHGVLELRDPSREIRIGDKLLLIAPHCDPTVNLYDRLHPFRDEMVEETWPIAARGASQ